MVAALIPGLCDDIAELCLLRVAYDHLSTVDSVCRRWRHLVRSTDFHTRRRLAGHNRPIFVFKVLSERTVTWLLLFDPTSGTCRCLPHEPSVQTYFMPNDPAVVGAGRYMVSIPRGGLSPVRIYDFCTGIWRDGARMPSLAYHYIDAAWDGARRVFIASGRYYKNDHTTLSVMCYYVEEDKWEAFSDGPPGLYTLLKAAFHAGVFHVIDCSVVGNEHILHSLDVSSRSWSTVQLRTRAMGIELNMYTIAPDGRMYCCCYDGKLSVRDGQTWQELVVLDLPLNVFYSRYLTSWKGGVLVIGTAADHVPVGGDGIKMYTANLKVGTDYNQNLVSWTPQRLPVEMKGYVIHGFWLEI